MIFTSGDFFLFLACTLTLYYFTLRQVTLNNIVILTSSYIFYGWLEWRLTLLLLTSSLIDYCCSLALAREKTPSLRRLWLSVSIVANLSILGFFKYADFFIASVNDGLQVLGLEQSYTLLAIILPVGISFYTFQSMSYTIDVYNRDVKACRNPLAYLSYVSFFPQLVAGPIERAGHLLPQMLTRRKITPNDINIGFRLILLGLFKKVVIADNLGTIVNRVYAAPSDHSAAELFVATLAFTFQIYLDFSAYSEIARGLARMMGFDIMRNFRSPYLSLSIREFWTRWHISLSTFFRDYVYIPLGGSRRTLKIHLRNILIVFLLSGLWHGAGWTFILWGALHGFGLIFENVKRRLIGQMPSEFAPVAWLSTFLFVMFSWVLFRAETIGDAITIYTSLFSIKGWIQSDLVSIQQHYWVFALAAGVVLVEALNAQRIRLSDQTNKKLLWTRHPAITYLYSVVCAVSIFWFGEARDVAFIYFQF